MWREWPADFVILVDRDWSAGGFAASVISKYLVDPLLPNGQRLPLLGPWMEERLKYGVVLTVHWRDKIALDGSCAVPMKERTFIGQILSRFIPARAKN